jgi:two-component system response regulator NreC
LIILHEQGASGNQKESFPAMSIKILLCDDHRIIREGLRSLLDKQPDMTIVGEGTNGFEACKLARSSSPDIIVLDVAMPGLNGIAAARRLQEEAPKAKILALSMHSDRHFVTGMLQAGAAGYLLKDCAFSELTTAIRTISSGGMYLSPQITGDVLQAFSRNTRTSTKKDKLELSGRESEILQLISEGKSTKDAAAQLNLSVKTVETHRMNIMRKVGVNSVAELTKYAIREGLTTLEG